MFVCPECGHAAVHGQVDIRPKGSTFHVKWLVAHKTYTGVGIRKGHTLFVGYASIAVYHRNGQLLDGTWAPAGGSQLGTEQLRRM